MLEKKVYTLSELKEILKEKNEFQPTFGKGYNAKDEADLNDKAVEDIIKHTQDVMGVVKEEEKQGSENNANPDYNKTLLDYKYSQEPSKEYKDRVEALLNGYSSKSEKDNSEDKSKPEFEKNADFSGNEKFYNNRKEINDKVSKAETDEKHAGLKSHNLPKERFQNKSLFNEDKKMKRLHFKNTTFLNEEDMLKRVPDDYKVDGNNFYMKDSKGNEYLVECVKDEICESYIHVNVLEYNACQEFVNEALSKFKHLSGYNSSDYLTSVERIAEDKTYNKLLNVTRELANNN